MIWLKKTFNLKLLGPLKSRIVLSIALHTLLDGPEYRGGSRIYNLEEALEKDRFITKI